jgi:ATP-dependent helicase YprA (DUF1998 family)
MDDDDDDLLSCSPEILGMPSQGDHNRTAQAAKRAKRIDGGVPLKSRRSFQSDANDDSLDYDAIEQMEEMSAMPSRPIPQPTAHISCHIWESLPPAVRRYYASKGIASLYPWQHECLSLPHVQRNGNLIYCLPTSGGKTLVAELLALKTMLQEPGKDVLFLLPYVSLVHEKVNALKPLTTCMDIAVELYAGPYGRYPPLIRQGRNSIYIATPEKAKAIVTTLIDGGRLNRLGLLIVDELHMIGTIYILTTLTTLILAD